MTVVYYTSTFFLDISLDIINVLKKHVDLHVFIEVTSASKNITVADISELPAHQYLAQPNQILSKQSLLELQPYFEGTASTHFVLHRHKTGFSFSTLQASLAVWKFVKPFKPQIIHFEGYTLRSIGMLPFLLSVKKVFLTIHDPVPHSGEGSWKISLPNFLFFNLPFKKYFLYYSDFARKLFEANYSKVKAPKLLVKMCPYSYYKIDQSSTKVPKKHILFFGRISPYKGVDMLLNAMPAVIRQFPNQQLIIAGKCTNGYELDRNLIERYPQSIHVINRYIANAELMQLISEAKIVVCPYLDATQSGVLMTAFALNTPVIASAVGSFPEFINDHYNGLLVEPSNASLLADKIKEALSDDYYKTLENNITQSNERNTWANSLEGVLQEYFSE